MDFLTEARRVILEESRALKILAQNLPVRFRDAVEAISNSEGRLVVSGIGKSGHIGRKISSTMASLGQKSFFLHPSEAQHGDLGMLDARDVLLLISYSGESVELFPIIDFAKRFGNKIVSISKSENSTLAKNSDIPLILPDIGEAGSFGIAPTISSTNTLALGDALAMSILVLKGFTKEQFRLLHPGGALGKGLSFIFDIMHLEIPLVNINDNMQNAVIEMTKYGFGCVGVIDGSEKLVGIVTDGDLRRKMSSDILSKPVDIVMTENPIVVSKNITASELLHTMETNKITNVFVVDTSGKPVGLVHVHDLIMNKVI
ncbi:MAG: KpsF/GutQ family sugar-phosphate isomerase [Alphaproteobacteria bacterium]|nr:KpsF/GutQ family sugar-phosphate isomerase [Alphaproteobacteria bacterium]